MLPRVREDLHVETPLVETGNGQTDTVDGDRALSDDVRREERRIPNRQPEGVAIRANLLNRSRRIHVPLDEVSADPCIGAERALEIHQRASPKRPERSDPRGFG